MRNLFYLLVSMTVSVIIVSMCFSAAHAQEPVICDGSPQQPLVIIPNNSGYICPTATGFVTFSAEWRTGLIEETVFSSIQETPIPVDFPDGCGEGVVYLQQRDNDIVEPSEVAVVAVKFRRPCPPSFVSGS